MSLAFSGGPAAALTRTCASRAVSVRRRRRLWRVLPLVLLVLGTAGAAAQEKPDFSGRWVLTNPEHPGADIPLSLAVRQTLVRTTARGEPMKPFFREIAIERQFAAGTRSETHLIGVLGGTVPGIGVDGRLKGPTSHEAVRWDGNVLIFESGRHTGQRPETGVWTEHREDWALAADGRLRVVIATRSSSDDPKTYTLYYRRP